MSLLLLLVSLRPALALDADTYAPDGSLPGGASPGSLQIPAPVIGDPGAWYAAAQLAWAHRPVVRQWPDGTVEPVLASSTALHLLGGYTAGERARLDVDVPVYLWQGVADPDLSDPGPAFGDVRLSATMPILRGDLFALGAAPTFSLPTGSAARLTGAGGASGGLALSARLTPAPGFALDASLGVRLGPDSALGEELYGSALQWGLGGGWQGGAFGAGAGLTGALSLADGLGSWNQNPLELHAHGSYDPTDRLRLMAGLGTGLIAGVGAPDLRLIVGASIHDPGARDTDGDGLEDKEDGCPTQAEDRDGFSDQDGCPDLDDDEDGVPDATDQCKNSPEDRDQFQDSDGCPDPDNDKDLIPDAEDRCPDVAGPASNNGCPPPPPPPPEPDQDGDQVPDSRDRCPAEPRHPDDPPATSDGCPKRVIRRANDIVILEVVYFDTSKATIQDRSHSLLDEVAATILANPDITLIEVGGHTDNQGNPDANLRLSQARAQAVVDYLVKKGVDASRLRAVGYGLSQPTDTNMTAEGRANNRRVEFKILQTAPQERP